MTNTVRIKFYAATGSGRRKGWGKVVDAVDATKRNGYAFDGEFLGDGEHDVPVGAVIVSVEPNGSAKHPTKYGRVHRITPDGEYQQLAAADWHEEFLTLRDAAAAALAGNTRTVADIDAELAALQQRITELEAERASV